MYKNIINYTQIDKNVFFFFNIKGEREQEKMLQEKIKKIF